MLSSPKRSFALLKVHDDLMLKSEYKMYEPSSLVIEIDTYKVSIKFLRETIQHRVNLMEYLSRPKPFIHKLELRSFHVLKPPTVERFLI